MPGPSGDRPPRFELTGWLVSRRYAALLLLCGALYLTGLGGYRLFDVDEPRYAETARRMVAAGDFLVPVFNGQWRFEKPVLTYWLIAGSYRLFGVNEFSARLPMALAAAGTVLLTCLLAGRLLSPGAGLAAGALLAICLQFLALSRWCLTDMPLTLFLTGALVTFALACDERDHAARRRLFLWAWACSALAVLTKGPVGLVLPGAIALAYLTARRELFPVLRRVPWGTGPALFALLALPWYLLVIRASGGEFFRVFILRHNLARFAGEVTAGGQHLEPFYYYLPVLLAGSWPWSLYALQALRTPLQEALGAFRRTGRAEGRLLFPLVWALGVLLFFSIARAKLPTYITPAYPPLAILVAGYLGALVARGRAGRGRFALLAPAGLGGLLALATALALVIRGPELARMPLEGWQYPAAALLAAGPLGALLLLWRGRPRGALGMLVAGQAALALVLALGVLPLVSRQRQEPQLRLIRRAESLLGGGGALAAYRYDKTAMVFYHAGVVRYLGPETIDSLHRVPAPAAVLTRERHLAELQGLAPGLRVVARDHELVLLLRPE